MASVKHNRAKRRTVVALPLRAKGYMGRKLSIAQQNFALDVHVREGLGPAALRERLREETGTAVSANALQGFLTRRHDEIVARKRLWNDQIDVVHLRHRRGRLDELVRMYALLVRQLSLEMCKTCLGRGVGVDSQGKALRCKTCLGRGTMVPKGVLHAYALGEDVGASALRLASGCPPAGCDLTVWDRMMACLREIRDEVGDTKVRMVIDPEEAERLADAKVRTAWADKVTKMSSQDFLGLLRKMGERSRGVVERALPEVIDVVTSTNDGDKGKKVASKE